MMTDDEDYDDEAGDDDGADQPSDEAEPQRPPPAPVNPDETEADRAAKGWLLLSGVQSSAQVEPIISTDQPAVVCLVVPNDAAAERRVFELSTALACAFFPPG
jgi:hypothetical protein